MTIQEKLDRFLKVQEIVFDNAIQEITHGKIESEWMKMLLKLLVRDYRITAM